MIAYAVRRLLIGIPVLLAASIFVFVIASLSGNPIDDMEARNPPVPLETRQIEAHRLGLDKSLPERYVNWLFDLVVHGDFGESTERSINIGDQLGERLWVTLRLVFVAMLLAVILAVISGVISAVKQYSKVDYGFTFMGFLALSIPSFWLALLLKEAGIAYNQSTGTQTFYTLGDKDYNHDRFDTWGKITDIAGHMVLPTIALTLITYAAWSRYQRGAMLEVLNSDYVRLARAKGLRSRQVMIRHALRTALIPLTTITAVDIGGIFGGAVITETVFNWAGMGTYLLESVYRRDVNSILGWLLISGLVVILFNIVADLLYAVLDPRIRYE
ncbi:ABC transporter permease [Dactylosporangium sucinum]|uniref:Peptide ABC transporter permease n=1 Tax=Dactylosporangium sucinum TaxID=1424081 RepID=A0A917WVW9_9ACTN|nr:ABC transporter permease [Dactylosporangium sucinum]GGM34513.1 peptide ABC transporter permease [Dactylosporangium sucinum]